METEANWRSKYEAAPTLADMGEFIPPTCFVPIRQRDQIVICLRNILWIEVKDVEKGVVVEYVDCTWPVDKLVHRSKEKSKERKVPPTLWSIRPTSTASSDGWEANGTTRHGKRLNVDDEVQSLVLSRPREPADRMREYQLRHALVALLGGTHSSRVLSRLLPTVYLGFARTAARTHITPLHPIPVIVK